MLTTNSPADRSSLPLRHALVERQGLARLVDVEALLAAAGPFVATRLAFLLIGLVAPLLFVDHAVRQQPTTTGWIQWDAFWFIGIAEHGYPWKLFPHLNYSSVAFFPAYPVLIRGLKLAGLTYDISAMIIPNAAFLGSLYYLYRLIRVDFAEPVATRALWLLAVFPTAIIFFVPYSESLYLLFAILTFWHLRRRQWLAAGLAGLLGSLTRQSGIVLLLPFLVEWYAAQGTVSARTLLRSGAAARALLPAALMPLGVILYLAYLWRVAGSPLAFLHVQRAWHRQLSWPWDGIVATIQRWSLQDPSGFKSAHQVHIVLELAVLALFAILLIIGFRRLRLSYTVYASAVWLVALVSPAIADNYWLPVMSSSRFALSVFPSFIVLALILGRPRSYQLCLTASAFMLGLATVVYVLGGWVA